MTASIRAEGVGIRFLLDRQQRLVTPGLARLRRRGTEVWGVRGVDLSIEPGRAVALVGPSGAGKTTLLRTIAGVLVPDEGRIAVDGRVGSLLSVEAGLTPNSPAARTACCSRCSPACPGGGSTPCSTE